MCQRHYHKQTLHTQYTTKIRGTTILRLKDLRNRDNKLNTNNQLDL